MVAPDTIGPETLVNDLCGLTWSEPPYRRGTLQPGRFADLLVLEEDPFEIDPERLEDLEPVLTVVGGRVVWPPSS